MADLALLRFRNLVQNVDTIDAHNEIAKNGGTVYWGWWKKPLEASPDPGLTIFAKDIHPGERRVLFIDSATRKLYAAELFEVAYRPGAETIPAPDLNLCPTYYRDERLPAWFKIGPIQELPQGIQHLDRFVWSRNNRTSAIRSIASLPDSAIEQDVLEIEFLDSNVSLWFLTPKEEIGIRERSKYVQPYARGLWGVPGRYALHLSDVHFGQNHAFRNQLARPSGARVGKESMVEALLDDLEIAGVQQNEVGALFVTGDLTWCGDAHEYENSLDAITVLCRRLGLHVSQVVVVPGNHDIEWRDAAGHVDDNAELNFRNFSTSLYSVPPNRSLSRIHRLELSGRRITIVALNSCRIESRENAGLGFVGREQLAEVGKFLKQLPTSNQELKMALVHHHVVPVNFLEEIDWQTKRLSVMIDGEGVLRTLMSFGVRILLHGHQHQPFYGEERRIVNDFVDPFAGKVALLDKTMAVIGGGSIGADRAHLNLVGRNAYNIVDFGLPGNEIGVRTRSRSSAGPGFVEYQQATFRY